MIDSGIPPRNAWPDGVLDRLRRWEQGDLVIAPPLFYFADPAAAIWEGTRLYTDTSEGPEVILAPDELTPQYGIVTTQTCDIAEEDSSNPIRPWVQISPVYSVTTWKRRRLEGGKGPRYWLLVPDFPEQGVWVADFRIELPVEKSWLAGQDRIEGFSDEEEKRRVGRRLEWLKGRSAFSRELNTLNQALYEALDDREPKDPELHEAVMERLEEVAINVDSYLSPGHVQFVFLTNAPITDECRGWLESWKDNLLEKALELGLQLHALDFRTLESVTAVEYRRMAVIWQR